MEFHEDFVHARHEEYVDMVFGELSRVVGEVADYSREELDFAVQAGREGWTSEASLRFRL